MDNKRKATTSRPASKRPVPARRVPSKRRKKKSGGIAGALLIVLLLIALVCTGAYLLHRKNVIDLSFILPEKTPVATSAPKHSEFSSLYDPEQTNNDGLKASEGNSIKVADLSITQGLNEDWLNVLLLGADSRNDAEPCRTDTMMICSVNQKTGEVKLTSLMRDTCISLPGHANTRLNSAYFYGGEQLAMKTVNEYLGMNIRYYAFVDFNGFASIAEALGGIDIDITENEMKKINEGVYEQYHVLINQGRMEFDAAAEEFYATLLSTYGKNVHLNGMQTLGYARIRKLDSDYARTERQRKVLNLMLSKLKGSNLSTIIGLVFGNSQYFQTNMDLNQITNLASIVLGNTSQMSADGLRLPVNGTYKEEKRGNDAMLYDTDWTLNKRELHEFIYN